eukprot:CAMPEP_0206415208 /NCGR_PEP_ID=MMETSP0294-20121207/35937_1 /ASSEMBLY_ACC=CAM_ASM_000327 /TAXON_ID=39354 /ORGANISM="Heterosigma akashiwo, Strain CCMP2393" /LENGTH=149 /DNA_ID=CAMNT_0053877473 /DNA_START=262 /DNA_END=707 /DNA_ORIENTATION=-
MHSSSGRLLLNIIRKLLWLVIVARHPSTNLDLLSERSSHRTASSLVFMNYPRAPHLEDLECGATPLPSSVQSISPSSSALLLPSAAPWLRRSSTAPPLVLLVGLRPAGAGSPHSPPLAVAAAAGRRSAGIAAAGAATALLGSSRGGRPA